MDSALKDGAQNDALKGAAQNLAAHIQKHNFYFGVKVRKRKKNEVIKCED